MCSSLATLEAFDEDGLWPTKDQELLLRAALLEKDAATMAWREWRQRVDLEGEFDQGSFRLMPLLFQNLKRHDVADPFMARLKGIYRRSWYETHKLFFSTRPILDDLHKAGVKTLLLKGAPLAVHYYKNLAIRPMSDLDILVPVEQARQAIEVMDELGWQRTERALDQDLKYRHALQYIDPEKGEVDLHWHALFECCQPDADNAFWKSCVPFSFEGIDTHMLDPTDTLFHVVVHGIRWNPVSSIRWIADATKVLETSHDEIDWRRLIDHGVQKQLTLRLRKGFSFLNLRMDQHIPDWVLQELSQQKIGAMETLESHYILRDKRAGYETFFGPILLAYADYRRYASDRGPLGLLFGFPEYLRYRWRLQGRADVLNLILKRGLHRVWRRLVQNDQPNKRLVSDGN